MNYWENESAKYQLFKTLLVLYIWSLIKLPWTCIKKKHFQNTSMIIYSFDSPSLSIYCAYVSKPCFNKAMQIMIMTIHCWTRSRYNTLILHCDTWGVKKTTMVLVWWLLGCQGRIEQPTLPVPNHLKFWKQNQKSEYEWSRRYLRELQFFFSLGSSMATKL